jgi:hypothetical protein
MEAMGVLTSHSGEEDKETKKSTDVLDISSKAHAPQALVLQGSLQATY